MSRRQARKGLCQDRPGEPFGVAAGFDKNAVNDFDREQVRPHANPVPAGMEIDCKPFSWNVIRLGKRA